MRLRLPCTKRRRPIGEGGSRKQSRSGGRLNGTLVFGVAKGSRLSGVLCRGLERPHRMHLLQLLGVVGASNVCRGEGANRSDQIRSGQIRSSPYQEGGWLESCCVVCNMFVVKHRLRPATGRRCGCWCVGLVRKVSLVHEEFVAGTHGIVCLFVCLLLWHCSDTKDEGCFDSYYDSFRDVFRWDRNYVTWTGPSTLPQFEKFVVHGAPRGERLYPPPAPPLLRKHQLQRRCETFAPCLHQAC